MKDKKLIVAFIGAGMIAEKHAEAFGKTGMVDIKWVARRNASKLQAFQNKFNIPNGTTDYKEVLNDPEVDAVVITTPPNVHYQIFIECLEAKKHILLEKPAGITREEVQKMVDAAKRYPQLKVCDCSCRHARLQPKYRKAKTIVDTGVLGDIYFIHHNSLWRQLRGGIEYHPEAKWFLDKSIAGGGHLLDWGVYDLSFHLGILSDRPELENIKSAFLKGNLDKVDPGTDVYNVEEHFAASLMFSGGLNYYWERANNAHVETPNETRVYGTKGGIKLSSCSWESDYIEFYDVEDEGRGKARMQRVEVDMPPDHSDDLELATHFIDVVLNDKKPAMPLELAQKHLNIIFDIYDAAGDVNLKL